MNTALLCLRIYIDGTQQVNQWSDTEKAGIKNFSVNTGKIVEIRIEYYEKLSSAHLQVSIEPAGGSTL